MDARHDEPASDVRVKLEPLEPEIDPVLLDPRAELIDSYPNPGSLAETAPPIQSHPPPSHFAPYHGYTNYIPAFDSIQPPAPRLNRNLSLPHISELMYHPYPVTPLHTPELQYPQYDQPWHYVGNNSYVQYPHVSQQLQYPHVSQYSHVSHQQQPSAQLQYPVSQYQPPTHLQYRQVSQLPPLSSYSQPQQSTSAASQPLITGRGLGLSGVPGIPQGTVEYHAPSMPHRTRSHTEDELAASGSLLSLHSHATSSRADSYTPNISTVPELSPSNTTSTMSTQPSFQSLHSQALLSLLEPLIPLEPIIKAEENELRIRVKALSPPSPIFSAAVPYNVSLPISFVDHPKRGRAIFNDAGVPIGWHSGEQDLPLPAPRTQAERGRSVVAGKENKPEPTSTVPTKRRAASSPPRPLAEKEGSYSPPILNQEIRAYMSERANAKAEGWRSVMWPVPPDSLYGVKKETAETQVKMEEPDWNGTRIVKAKRGKKKARITV